MFACTGSFPLSHYRSLLHGKVAIDTVVLAVSASDAGF